MNNIHHPSGLGVPVTLRMDDDVMRVVALVERARWSLSAYSAARPLREFTAAAATRSPADITDMPEYDGLAAAVDAYNAAKQDGGTTSLLGVAERVSAHLMSVPLPAVQYSRQQVSASEQQQWSDARKLYAAAEA